MAPTKWDHMRGRCFGTQYPKDARHWLLLLRTGSSKITFKTSLDGSTPRVGSIFSACGDLNRLYRLYRKLMQCECTLQPITVLLSWPLLDFWCSVHSYCLDKSPFGISMAPYSLRLVIGLSTVYQMYTLMRLGIM